MPTNAETILAALVASLPARPLPLDPAKPAAAPCRHCQRGPVSRPRGLCWPCYHLPGVRDLYPSTSKFGYRGPGNFNGQGALPMPTEALPGTPEKVAVLAERAAHRQALWHPDDAK